MSDDVDKAVDLHNEITNKQIEHIRKQANKPEELGNGYCLFCREKVKLNERWCDSDCRDDWEHERRMNRLY